MLRVLHRDQHGFFGELSAGLAGIASMVIASEVQMRGTSRPFAADDYIPVEGVPRVSNVELHFFPFDLLTADGDLPSSLRIEETPLASRKTSEWIRVPVFAAPHQRLIESAFLQYFESNRSSVEKQHSLTAAKWPDVWYFGRMIRNAIVHRGVISVDDRNARAACWRGLRYSFRDNVHRIWPSDIGIVEYVLLMEEMDAEMGRQAT